MTVGPSEILEECRARFGPAPRSFGRWDHWRHLRLAPPLWLQLNREDLLWDVLGGHRDALTRGQVVWGHVVRANTPLFEAGRGDSPASVVYSFAPVFDDEPDELALVAQRLFRLSGSPQEDPELRKLATSIADEKARELRVPVPPSLAGSEPVFLTTVLVSRRHLPSGYLSASQFPLVAHPDVKGAMILPSRFWPESLIRDWTNRPSG
ncbi:hypothetical protein [Actinomadura roseirufa]|uniref:hypothetical protein n=1 Tax=Actinomadura roseirufa TaxID=2094049 RepID=UPI00104161BA|nr:hypothetical protein [Actinomadura roseirufa]